MMKTWLGRQGYPLRIEQETEIWPFEQMIYRQLSICHGELLINAYGILTYKRKWRLYQL